MLVPGGLKYSRMEARVCALFSCMCGALGMGGRGNSLRFSMTWLPFLPLLPVPQVFKGTSIPARQGPEGVWPRKGKLLGPQKLTLQP